MNGKIAAFAAVGMLLAGQASAADAALAQMSSVKGSVLVSQNGQLAPASNATALRAGDRVVAKDGQASLKFADGCVVTLKPNAMVTVGAASPCAAGTGLVSATQGDSAQNFMGLSGFGAALATFGILALILIVVGDSGNDNTTPPVSP